MLISCHDINDSARCSATVRASTRTAGQRSDSGMALGQRDGARTAGAGRRPADRPGRRKRRRTLPHPSCDQQVAVHTRFLESAATVVISGELDICAVPSLERALREVLDQGADKLVLDLAGVTFIDCASVRALAAASHALPGSRRALIRRPSPMVERVLRVTGMSACFWIERPVPGYPHARLSVSGCGQEMRRTLAPVSRSMRLSPAPRA
jgi:anti-sigma B factor antagonist